MEPLLLSDRIRLPAHAMEAKAVRSSGPGGQNVNKVASKIQLWIRIAALEGLTPEEDARLREKLGPRLDPEGRILVSSQATRDQGRNLEDARAKAADLIRSALRRPRTRKATRPTKAARDRRLREKLHRAQRRAERALPED